VFATAMIAAFEAAAIAGSLWRKSRPPRAPSAFACAKV
jgi:hypothetical protein